LLNIKFSTSRGILTQFIEKNEAQLFALTARDAVAGELQNSVYAFDTPAKLFDIRQVTVEADTIGGHVADAGKLAKLIERFRQEPDGWRDDVLVAEVHPVVVADRGDATAVAWREVVQASDEVHDGKPARTRRMAGDGSRSTERACAARRPVPAVGEIYRAGCAVAAADP
jgi:hypothetical protein